jgi:hypothetical protein
MGKDAIETNEFADGHEGSVSSFEFGVAYISISRAVASARNPETRKAKSGSPFD